MDTWLLAGVVCSPKPGVDENKPQPIIVALLWSVLVVQARKRSGSGVLEAIRVLHQHEHGLH